LNLLASTLIAQTGLNLGPSQDVNLNRDAADTLAQRRSTNPQAFRLYNTYTDASTYERAEMGWSGNTFFIGISNAGNGTTARRLLLSSGTGISIAVSSTMELQSGSLVFKWYNGSTIGVGPSFSDIYFTNPNNFVSVRNGTAGQKFGVYNTFTDVNNYERLAATWASNICTIGLEQAGTGLVRSLVIAGANATSGAGGNVTITAGNGSGVGAGGNIILQPGAQGTSGGNGTTIIRSSGGSNRVIVNDGATTEFKDTNATTRLTIDCRTNGWNIFNGTGVHMFQISSTAILDMYSSSFNGVMYGYSSLAWAMNTPATFSTDQTDYLLATNQTLCKKIHRLATTNASGSAIHSFKIFNGAWGGHELKVYNVGSYNLTLKHNSATGTAAWRMYNSTGADIVLAPLVYNGQNKAKSELKVLETACKGAIILGSEMYKDKLNHEGLILTDDEASYYKWIKNLVEIKDELPEFIAKKCNKIMEQHPFKPVVEARQELFKQIKNEL
jgi:hypothetical protein